MSRVTILIPTYNRASLIGKTIENCFQQSFKDFNVMIYDDGSTDKTEDVIRAALKRYPGRIKYIKGGSNKGIGHSRKALLQNLSTEYGVWLDSDDYMKRDRLQKCVSYLDQNKGIDVVYSYLRRFDETVAGVREGGNPIVIDTTKYDKKNYDSLKFNTTCATAFFRNKVRDIDIVPLRYGSEDVLWLWKILNDNIKVGQISEVLYLYRSHKHRLSIEKRSKKEEKRAEELIIHQKIKEYSNG